MFKYLSLLYVLNIRQLLSAPYTQDCSPSNPCNATIECPPSHSTQCDDEGFIVNCIGTSICESSTIICPESQSSKCSIICDGELSCSSIIIQSYSTDLNITSTGSNALFNSEIDSISPSTITITHNGATNGLNDMNINTINDFDTINIQCIDIDSIRNNCWNSDTPPKLSYGQEYDQECTIISTSKCVPDGDPLIANPEDEDEASVSEEKEPVTTTPSDRMTDSELAVASSRSSNQHYGMDSAVILIAMGMLCGVLVSICICLLFCLHYHNKQEKMQLRIAQVNIASNMRHNSANNTSVSNILPPGDGPLSMDETELTSPSKMGSIKSTLKKIKTSPSFVGKLSPSLKKLSPRLNPSKMDLSSPKKKGLKLASTDSMIVQAAESIQPDNAIMIDEMEDGIVVTVDRYQNADNLSDEDPVNSPSSSAATSPYKPPLSQIDIMRPVQEIPNINIPTGLAISKLTELQLVASLSQDTPELDEEQVNSFKDMVDNVATDGVEADEFIVYGDDETNQCMTPLGK